MERVDPKLLDDDDGIDLSFAGPVASLAVPRHRRWLDQMSAYLPLLLMALLAAVTWWLVNRAPPVDAADDRAASLRHEPDYSMAHFTIQRFGVAGALRTQIDGDRLRHYPDTDTLEIDNARVRAVADNGSVTFATARRALANGDGSEVQLFDDARVVRAATATEAAVEFRSEFLHAFRNIERVRSHLPVTVTQGATQVRADGMEYDNLARTVDLKGHTRAVFDALPKKAKR